MVYQIGDGLQCAYGNAMRGLSYVKPLVPTAFIAYFMISLPIGYVLGIHFHWGVTGIWWAFPFGLTIAGLLYRYYFYKKLKEIA